MLRGSAHSQGGDIDLASLLGRAEGDGGVPHGKLLVAFSEALIGDDEAGLDAVRVQVLKDLGDAALVDASAVAALFDAIDRVADATAIPLEDEKVAEMADFITEFDILPRATDRIQNNGR